MDASQNAGKPGALLSMEETPLQLLIAIISVMNTVFT
jgi:hypothetical protein